MYYQLFLGFKKCTIDLFLVTWHSLIKLLLCRECYVLHVESEVNSPEQKLNMFFEFLVTDEYMGFLT